MNSFQLLNTIELIQEYLTSEEIIFLEGIVKQIVKYKNRIKDFNKDIALNINSNTIAQYRTSYLANLKELKETLKSIEIRKLFITIQEICIYINQIDEKLNIKFQQQLTIGNLENYLIKFTKNYELFLQENYSEKYIIELIFVSQSIIEVLSLIKITLICIASNLQNRYELNHCSEELTLLLNSNHNIQEFINKLQSIKNLYSELCYLFQISESEYPLQIVKIESGSLFVKVFGQANVLKTLSTWIENTVSYFHRNYTNEGKIKSIPNKLEVIENILEITKKLDEAGIDTTDTKEKLQKSSLIITKELNLLLGGEPEVIINNNKHSIKAELQQKYLEKSKTHLLKTSKEELEENND